MGRSRGSGERTWYERKASKNIFQVAKFRESALKDIIDKRDRDNKQSHLSEIRDDRKTYLLSLHTYFAVAFSQTLLLFQANSSLKTIHIKIWQMYAVIK